MEKRKETKERITRGDSESREDTEQERSGDNCFSTKEIYYDARSEVHETVKWVTNESDKNGNGSVDTIEPYETEHLSQVIIVVNDSTGPTNQDTEYKSQEETKAMAKSKDDSDQNDEEEFYDSHSDIEELISDAEMHKSDPVTQIEVEVHHKLKIETIQHLERRFSPKSAGKRVSMGHTITLLNLLMRKKTMKNLL